ncbi:hypothetical protein D3C81_1394440 [compost metagenome]
MATLDQAQLLAGTAMYGVVQEAGSPRAGGVDQQLGVYLDFLILLAQGGLPITGMTRDGHAFGARQYMRAVFCGGECIQYDQARIVDPAIRICKPFAELHFQWRTRTMLAQINAVRTRQEFTLCQVVIQEQAGAYHPCRTLTFVVRHDEAQRMHDVRCGAQQDLALNQRFAHQAEFIVFQIAQATVDQLGGG